MTISRSYLEVAGLSKSIDGRSIISGIEMQVAKGDIISILGPSGSGKSTLLRLIAGLDRPDQGSIECDGAVYFSDSDGVHLTPERRNIGMVFQDYGLWPHLTVLDHVAFPLWSRRRQGNRLWSRERILERARQTLALFRMEKFGAARPSQLSGGQQQRVAFARAIAAQPDLVFLDEAFSALDAQLRETVRDELLTILRSHHMTVLNVTHDQVEAMTISDRIFLLREGHEEQFDTPVDLYDHPKSLWTARFVGHANLLQVRLAPNGSEMILANGDVVNLRSGDLSESWLAGNLVYWLVRPESIALRSADSSAGRHRIGSGKVTRQRYQLGRWAVTAWVDQIGELVFYQPRPLTIGSPIDLSLSVETPHFLPALSPLAVKTLEEELE